MKTILSLLLFAIVPSAAQAAKMHHLFGSFENGKQIAYEISAEKLRSLPAWDGLSAPPLSLQQAMNLAMEKMKQETGSSEAAVTELELNRKIDGCDAGSCAIDYWFYEVDVKSGPAYEPDEGDEKTYVILMDGSFVVPTSP